MIQKVNSRSCVGNEVEVEPSDAKMCESVHKGYRTRRDDGERKAVVKVTTIDQRRSILISVGDQ